MKSRRSSGTRVALPPAARTRSSVSSSPPTVRPTKTRWAPSRANRSATAAPMPREAPVISAILPARRVSPLIAPTERSGGDGEQRQLHRDLAVVGVGERDRVVAGKAGVAEMRRELVAAGLAHRPIQPVDRDEGEAVDPDELGHLLEVEAGGEELVARWRGDAVKAREASRRARNPHMHFACPGIAHHLDDLGRGRAAHDRIVDQDDPLAFEIGAVGVVLEADAEMADLLGRLDEGAADIMVADDAEVEGQP